MNTFYDPIFRQKSFLKNKIKIKENDFVYEFDIYVLINWFINSLNNNLKNGIISLNSSNFDLINPITNMKFSQYAKNKIFNTFSQFGINIISHNKKYSVKIFLEKLKKFSELKDKDLDNMILNINTISNAVLSHNISDLKPYKKDVKNIFTYVNSL